MLVPVIASDAHLAHDGLIEVMAGREIACYEAQAADATDGRRRPPPDTFLLRAYADGMPLDALPAVIGANAVAFLDGLRGATGGAAG